MAKRHEIAPIRSSAAEYLTFVAVSGNGGVEAVFADSELEAASVIQKFRITATDGKGCDTQHYKLAAIIAVGYKVNSEPAVQFRKWATGIVESFTRKGFAMDDERLKNDGTVLGKQYFEERYVPPGWGCLRDGSIACMDSGSSRE